MTTALYTLNEYLQRRPHNFMRSAAADRLINTLSLIHPENTTKKLSYDFQAAQFMSVAKENFKSGIIAPPITLKKIQAIYQLFDQLNLDLTGHPEGSIFEQEKYLAWKTLWQKARHDEQQSSATINSMQKEVLNAYRFKIIHLCRYKPKGKQTHEMDEMRVKEYLQLFNQYYDTHVAEEAYDEIMKKLYADFEESLGLDLQSLSRYLNIDQHAEYLKKFEEIISRKPVEYIGQPAIERIFNEVTKDKEFFTQLPLLLKKGEALKKFLITNAMITQLESPKSSTFTIMDV